MIFKLAVLRCENSRSIMQTVEQILAEVGQQVDTRFPSVAHSRPECVFLYYNIPHKRSYFQGIQSRVHS